MLQDALALDRVQETRTRLATRLAELHRLHIAMADDARAMKGFAFEGRALAEIELACEMLEQYLAASNAFLENMRGRFEARMALLRRGEPTAAGNHEDHAGHAEFWLAFSRLAAVLRRVGHSAEV
jgi:hypothetical protein